MYVKLVEWKEGKARRERPARMPGKEKKKERWTWGLKFNVRISLFLWRFFLQNLFVLFSFFFIACFFSLFLYGLLLPQCIIDIGLGCHQMEIFPFTICGGQFLGNDVVVGKKNYDLTSCITLSLQQFNKTNLFNSLKKYNNEQPAPMSPRNNPLVKWRLWTFPQASSISSRMLTLQWVWVVVVWEARASTNSATWCEGRPLYAAGAAPWSFVAFPGEEEWKG